MLFTLQLRKQSCRNPLKQGKNINLLNTSIMPFLLQDDILNILQDDIAFAKIRKLFINDGINECQ